MPLKFQVASLDEVPEAQRQLYTQHDGRFFLDVDGAVSKEKLDEFRTTNIELKRQMDELKKVDPKEYQRLVDLEKELKKGKTVPAEEVDRIVTERITAMRTEYDGKLNEAATLNQNLSTRLEAVMIDASVKDVAAKGGALPTALDDVLSRAKAVFRVKDGQVVAFDTKGQPLYDKDGTSPLSIESWVKGLKASAPHLFNMPRGTGAPGGGGPGGMDPSKMSSVDKISAGLAAQNG